ncbi:MAG: septum formation family protein [Microcella sp.]|uniref:septum formation family protein n=1 Tax=Microcella sp. TaxID=1913979 RepID=UPI0024C9A131|nr:septum formation family protein [Microcella sp.]UYN83897.1 MAG: septum formation family protein [Microcella sp.]
MHHLRPSGPGHGLFAEHRPLIHRGLVSAATLLSVAALTGCTALDAVAPTDQPIRDDDGLVIEANLETDAFALLVGDCIDGLGSLGEISTVATVPCDAEHEGEVYASIVVSGTSFPGSDALVSRAEIECRAALEQLVGVTYFETPLDFVYLAPTADSWSADDREILCVVVDPSGPRRGSLTAETLRP